jgi:hypothetical protein
MKPDPLLVLVAVAALGAEPDECVSWATRLITRGLRNVDDVAACAAHLGVYVHRRPLACRTGQGRCHSVSHSAVSWASTQAANYSRPRNIPIRSAPTPIRPIVMLIRSPGGLDVAKSEQSSERPPPTMRPPKVSQ